jgi:hypothetical protein
MQLFYPNLFILKDCLNQSSKTYSLLQELVAKELTVPVDCQRLLFKGKTLQVWTVLWIVNDLFRIRDLSFFYIFPDPDPTLKLD